eukprot:7739538-Karenia_brevis.AAC.1
MVMMMMMMMMVMMMVMMNITSAGAVDREFVDIARPREAQGQPRAGPERPKEPQGSLGPGTAQGGPTVSNDA